jgi:hypothetical protein
MKSRLVTLAATLMLLVAMGATSAAEDRIEIGVTFEVRAGHFTNGFDAAQIAELTARSGTTVAQALERHIKFVAFTGNAAAPYKLQVLLANPKQNDSEDISGFGFHLKLTGPDVPATAARYLEFRPADRFFEPVGSVDALVREIDQAIDKMDYRDFVATFLSEIPIADSGEFRKDQTSWWVIKRDRLALCIGYDSVLQVKSQFPFGDGDQIRRESFPAKVIDIQSEAGIIAETTDALGDKARLLHNVDQAKVKVERVAVSDYYLCQAPVSASEVSFPEAGGGQ